MTDKPRADLAAFDPATLESFVQANRTAMKGFEQLSRYFYETAAQNFNTAVETSKRLSKVKSLGELAVLQGQLSQEFYETVVERNKTAKELGAKIMQASAAHAHMPMPSNNGVRAPVVRPQGAKLA